jgi:hypothetical protein
MDNTQLSLLVKKNSRKLEVTCAASLGDFIQIISNVNLANPVRAVTEILEVIGC